MVRAKHAWDLLGTLAVVISALGCAASPPNTRPVGSAEAPELTPPIAAESSVAVPLGMPLNAIQPSAARHCIAASQTSVTREVGATTLEPLTSAISCRAFQLRNLHSVERELRRRYKRLYSPSRIDVAFSCDRVSRITHIELEYADEASRQLRLLGFTPRAHGDAYDARAIDVRAPAQLPAGYDDGSAAKFELKAAVREVAGPALDLETVRGALAAMLSEVPLVGMGAFSVSGRASSMHRVVLLQGIHPYASDSSVDPSGSPAVHPRLERHYTGQQDSREQSEYLPLELASKPLAAAIPDGAFGSDLTDDHRHLVEARFRASFPDAPEWLRELFLVLAARAGSPELIPMLLDVARTGPESEQVLAIGALAAISGWDVRFDAQGALRPAAEVAADYERECTR